MDLRIAAMIIICWKESVPQLGGEGQECVPQGLKPNPVAARDNQG